MIKSNPTLLCCLRCRRLMQYRLRTLLILTTVIAVWLAWVYLRTHVWALIWVAGLRAAGGIGFSIIGLFFPHAIHLL